MNLVILSLGSNLSSKIGDRFDNLEYALSLLNGEDISIEKISSFYESPSYPNFNHPKFLNIVISVKTNLSPLDLILFLLNVEEKLGRKRDIKNEPRVCDIDIIDYKGKLINLKYQENELIIPHKNMNSRSFVLYPLEEIMPEWKHPKTKESVLSLINKLSDEARKSILKIKKN